MSGELEQKLEKRQYMRKRQRGVHQLTIKPSVVNKLKGYYDEYVMTCQQNQYPVVEFHSFITDFCEIGFLNWRFKTKGK